MKTGMQKEKIKEGGEKIMKNRIYIWFASVFVMAIVMSFGCGGGGGDEYTGPTSTVRISGSSVAQGAAIGENGTILFDADGVSEGSGGADGVESIYDAIQPACKFTLAGAALASGESEDGLVEVRLSTGPACASVNKCITCTVTDWLQACTISCEGTVPSNEAVAADSVKLQINFMHYFGTDMPDGTEAELTFKGEVTNWSQFKPYNASVPGDQLIYDYTYCDGSTDYLDLNMLSATISSNTTSWISIYNFEADDATPNGEANGHENLKECQIVQTIIAEMPLTGADTPGATVNITGGSVTLTGTLCDDMDNCEAPTLNP